jgi:hypothetical protein
MNLRDIEVNIKRFWEKFDKSDGCWNWNAGKLKKGYGYFGIKQDGERHSITAHRLMYLLKYGTIPDGMQVCHHCDNPSCVNPGHLFLGTQLDNIRDCWNKGRANPGHPRGEICGNSKLTWDQARVIRARLLLGEKCRWLAAEYNVSHQNILAIDHGKTWVEHS